MKKIILIILLISSISYSQQRTSLFKGLLIGMNKKELKTEYKKNKDIYTNVDIGNGWVYKTDLANMYIDSKTGLKGIYFLLKGTKLSGVGYQNTRNALDMTRQFFEEIGYSVFYENKYWNLPLNFSSTYGLIMTDKAKTKIVHLFPTKAPGNNDSHAPGLILYEYKVFMDSYKNRLETIEKKKKNAGF
tara:strand:- start:1562 stop:2125 length:564 start_codon:yes stop_codon:yes gene_type:complete